MSDNVELLDPFSDEGKTQMMQEVGCAGEVYQPINYLELSDESFIQIYVKAKNYHKTKNVYYAISAYTQMVSSGLSPPVWVLDALCAGFKKHLSDPDPKKLAKQLGVSGGASGATNPFNEMINLSERFNAMSDMYLLIALIDIPKRKAADAVKKRYKDELGQLSLKYIVEFFEEKWLPLQPETTSPRDAVDLAAIAKFVNSFPVNARRLIKKYPVR